MNKMKQGLIAALLFLLLFGCVGAAAQGLTMLTDGQTIDLDGDGVLERISFSMEQNEYEEYDHFTLRVDEEEVSSDGCCLTGALATARLNVDEDGSDVLLFVEEAGMSQDWLVYVYSFHGGKLREVGALGSSLADLEIDNDMITGRVRGRVLQTWYHPEDYVLAFSYIWDEETDGWAEGPMLCKVPRFLYPVGTLVTMKGDLAAQVSQSDTTTAFRVKKGDKLLINASDDLAWLYVSIPWIYQQDPDYEGLAEGWVSIDGLDILGPDGWVDTYDLMDGLFWAD